MAREHLLLAGGGSGGHVFPALAVASEMQTRGWRVSWLGRREGLERSIVEGAGLAYSSLPASAVVGRGALRQIQALAGLTTSAWRARAVVKRLDAGLILGTGGYVSAPGVLGGVLAHRPVVLLEPNAVPGLANRWLSRWAAVAAVADRSAAAGLRCRVVETGVPVRAVFFEVERSADTTDTIRLLVLGGSQGAKQINELVPAALEGLEHPAPIEVVHQTGETLVEETRAAYASRRIERTEIEVVPFIGEMHRALGRADLVISRAGAITLAEICAVGRAALLLPLDLAGSHQVTNAEGLQSRGGARVMRPGQLDASSLRTTIEEMVRDRDLLVRMGQINRETARPNAVGDIADLVQQTAEAN